jgi:hypothetical protein
MSEAKFITYRNKSPREQVALLPGGEQVVFAPANTEGSEQVVQPSQALNIEAQLGEYIERVDLSDLGESLVVRELPKTLWVANLSGDPDAPEEVVVGNPVNRATGRREPLYMPNRKRDPITIKKQKKGRQYTIHGPDGLPSGATAAPENLVLPPYRRFELSRTDAEWLVNRTANFPPNERGILVVSRPPSEFEPDMAWSLGDMQIWLDMVDPKLRREGKTLRTEAELQKEARAAEQIHKEKQLAMKRVFMRSADPRYNLPSKADFEAFKAAVTGETKPESKRKKGDAHELLEKNLELGR